MITYCNKVIFSEVEKLRESSQLTESVAKNIFPQLAEFMLWEIEESVKLQLCHLQNNHSPLLYKASHWLQKCCCLEEMRQSSKPLRHYVCCVCVCA